MRASIFGRSNVIDFLFLGDMRCLGVAARGQKIEYAIEKLR
jgi:hypothetical protein